MEQLSVTATLALVAIVTFIFYLSANRLLRRGGTDVSDWGRAGRQYYRRSDLIAIGKTSFLISTVLFVVLLVASDFLDDDMTWMLASIIGVVLILIIIVLSIIRSFRFLTAKWGPPPTETNQETLNQNK